MADQPITKQQLINASEDADDLGVFMNGDSSTDVHVRSGATYPSLAKLVTQIGYKVPVDYASGLLMDDPTETVLYNNVAYAPIGSQIPFTTSGTFETAKFRVVQGLKNGDVTEFVDARLDFGAKVDSATDDLSALNSAFTNFHQEVFLQEGDSYVSAAPTNDFGADAGPGRIMKTITGGRQQLNLRADYAQHIYGQENLVAFFTAIRGQSAGASAKIVLSGDSTTYGDSASSPFLPQDLVLTFAAEAGYKVTVVNRGQSGKNVKQWRTTYLAGDLAENGKLLILRWGINDPAYLKNDSAAPVDAGQDYPNRRDIADFKNDLRQGLATIRGTAGCDIGNLSIVLMTPNSTSDTPNARDERWYEQVRKVVRKAARDYQCAFFDTYAIWNQSRGLSGLMFDNVLGDGRSIHPLNPMNSLIYTKLAQLIYPNLRSKFLPGVLGLLPATANPNDVMIGVNIHRMTSASAFPGNLDGAVITVRTADDIGLQIAWDYQAGALTRMPAIRIGYSNTWQPWLSQVAQDITLQNSWVEFESGSSLRASKSWKMVTLSGCIKNGTVTTGTLLGTLPAGYRPFRTQRFAVPTGAAFNTFASIAVLPDGQILIQSTATAAGLSLDGITFESFT